MKFYNPTLMHMKTNFLTLHKKNHSNSEHSQQTSGNESKNPRKQKNIDFRISLKNMALKLFKIKIKNT